MLRYVYYISRLFVCLQVFSLEIIAMLFVFGCCLCGGREGTTVNCAVLHCCCKGVIIFVSNHSVFVCFVFSSFSLSPPPPSGLSINYRFCFVSICFYCIRIKLLLFIVVTYTLKCHMIRKRERSTNIESTLEYAKVNSLFAYTRKNVGIFIFILLIYFWILFFIFRKNVVWTLFRVL